MLAMPKPNSRADVAHVARLARLRLTDDELAGRTGALIDRLRTRRNGAPA